MLLSKTSWLFSQENYYYQNIVFKSVFSWEAKKEHGQRSIQSLSENLLCVCDT